MGKIHKGSFNFFKYSAYLNFAVYFWNIYIQTSTHRRMKVKRYTCNKNIGKLQWWAVYAGKKHSRLLPVKQRSRKLDGSGHSFCYFSRWILQTRIFLMLIPREAFNVYLSCTCTAAVNILFCTAKNYLNIIKYFLRNPNTNNF